MSLVDYIGVKEDKTLCQVTLLYFCVSGIQYRMTMAMNPSRISMSELQKCLKDRGVVVSHERRSSLEDLFTAATQLNLSVDPDGICEDRGFIIAHKLVTPSGHQLDNSSLLHLTSSDISILPIIAHIDVYNYLKVSSHYTYSTLRQNHKMEAYGLF